MKKDILEKIKVAASWLPAETFKTNVRKSGAQLIAEGKEYVNTNGKRSLINKNHQYIVEVDAPVNHVERMKAAWERDNVNGIEQYLKKYDEYIQKLREAKQKANGHSPTTDGGSIPDPVQTGEEGKDVARSDN